MLNIIIIILVDGNIGYNVFNVYEPDNINNLNKNYIFLIYIENIEHFEYLRLNENNPNYTTKENYFEYINSLCNKNISTLADIRKKVYPISLFSSPNIYNEMYDFWKSKCKILPTGRFINSSNKYLYTNRFKEQTWNKYYLYKDRLY